MKLYYIFWLITSVIITVTACNETGTKTSTTVTSSHNRLSALKNAISEADKNIFKKISNLPKVTLPFGSKLLMTIDLPKTWIQSTDEKGNVHPPIFERKMTKIERSYDSIYRAKAITLLQFSKTKFINFNNHDDSLFLKDISKFNFLCDYKYRLPNIGPYECYYQSLKLTAAYNDEFVLGKRYTDNYYLEYGNLVFYDASSGLANIVNIYYTSSGNERYGSDYKWFYIDSQKRILLYRAGSDEGNGYYSLSEIINVDSDGKFVVNKVPASASKNK